jgi:hypothetical protein
MVRTAAAGLGGPTTSTPRTSLTTLSGWVGVAGTAVSAGGAVATPTVRALLDRQEKQAALKANDLYYLYQLNSRA